VTAAAMLGLLFALVWPVAASLLREDRK